jgi:hypothetical protein
MSLGRMLVVFHVLKFSIYRILHKLPESNFALKVQKFLDEECNLFFLRLLIVDFFSPRTIVH